MDKTNMFIEPILMKRKKHDFKAWKAKRKVIKYCKSTSPSFNDLCAIADFIALLRNVYMYSNNDKFHLFAASYPKGYHAGNCKTMIYSEGSFSITFIMFLETREIQIELTRTGQSSRADKEVLPAFEDGKYQFKDQYDQERMLFIVSSLMNGVIELVKYYYKNKRI